MKESMKKRLYEERKPIKEGRREGRKEGRKEEQPFASCLGEDSTAWAPITEREGRKEGRNERRKKERNEETKEGLG